MRGIMVLVMRRWTGASPEESCGIALVERRIGKKGGGITNCLDLQIFFVFHVNWSLLVMQAFTILL